MLTITPIGSCRVSGPLRLRRAEGMFSINDRRILGYSHSSAEAVQQMHAFDPDFNLSENLWPLVAANKDPVAIQNQEHRKSDLYIVELSSAKILSIGDTYVQLNYVGRFFKDFFSDKERAKLFWRFCRLEDQGRMNEFLLENWSSSDAQIAQSNILKKIRIRLSSEQTLYDDIKQLQDGLGNVLIMTHVNAVTSTGEPIASRSKFIDQVTSAATKAGVTLYNPTKLMEEMGQSAAIADHSTSLAHFTDDFSRKIFDEWSELVISNISRGKV